MKCDFSYQKETIDMAINWNTIIMKLPCVITPDKQSNIWQMPIFFANSLLCVSQKQSYNSSNKRPDFERSDVLCWIKIWIEN